MLWIALTPLLVLIFLLTVMRKPAIISLPIAWLTAILCGIAWGMQGWVLAEGALKGILVAVDIILIIIGALALLETLAATGQINKIKKSFKKISKDPRVLAIVIAWSFGSFIEGAAGFGTPAALAAPLLASLGIPAMTAVIVSLIANSTSVSFGAVGTPVLVGLATATESTITLEKAAVIGATVHAIIGTLIPLLIACVVAKKMQGSFRKGLEVWKFAIFAGLSFTVPYMLISFLGPEFPSFLGGLIGLAIVLTYLKVSIRALAPYGIAALLLLCTRIPPVREALQNIAFKITTQNTTHTLAPFLNPGVLLLITALITLAIYHKKKQADYRSIMKKTARTFIALAFATSLVQVYLLSGTTGTGMPQIIAQEIAQAGQLMPALSPFIGLFGAFLTGSNTVSNIFFAPFQAETAQMLALPLVLLLALQNVGGAIGNMIAPHNVIAASATVGIKDREGEIIRHTILPSLGYALLAGLLGLLAASMLT